MPENSGRRPLRHVVRDQYSRFRGPLRQRVFQRRRRQTLQKSIQRSHTHIRRLYAENEEVECKRINAYLLAAAITFAVILFRLIFVIGDHQVAILVSELMLEILVIAFVFKKCVDVALEGKELQRLIRNAWNRMTKIPTYKRPIQRINSRWNSHSSSQDGSMEVIFPSLVVNKTDVELQGPPGKSFGEPSKTDTTMEQEPESRVLDFTSVLRMGDRNEENNMGRASSFSLLPNNRKLRVAENRTSRFLHCSVFVRFLRYIRFLNRSYRDRILREALCNLYENRVAFNFREELLYITDPRQVYDFIQSNWDFIRSFVPRSISTSAALNLRQFNLYSDESVLTIWIQRSSGSLLATMEEW